jgi:hypothetical protein
LKNRLVVVAERSYTGSERPRAKLTTRQTCATSHRSVTSSTTGSSRTHRSPCALARGACNTAVVSGKCGPMCLGGGTAPPPLIGTGSVLILERIDIKVIDIQRPDPVRRPLVTGCAVDVGQGDLALRVQPMTQRPCFAAVDVEQPRQCRGA